MSRQDESEQDEPAVVRLEHVRAEGDRVLGELLDAIVRAGVEGVEVQGVLLFAAQQRDADSGEIDTQILLHNVAFGHGDPNYRSVDHASALAASRALHQSILDSLSAPGLEIVRSGERRDGGWTEPGD